LLGELLKFLFGNGAFGECGQHLFDRTDTPGEAQIVGAIDGAHATLADKLLNFVTSA
jgi:hypothetical protein